MEPETTIWDSKLREENALLLRRYLPKHTDHSLRYVTIDSIKLLKWFRRTVSEPSVGFLVHFSPPFSARSLLLSLLPLRGDFRW